MNFRRLVMVSVCAVAPAAHAAEIASARVDEEAGYYRVRFAVLIEGHRGRVLETVTDYARLDRLSPTVVASRLLSGHSGGSARVELTMRPCVLVVFCKTITKVSDARVDRTRARVTFRIVPELSDFDQGRETINVTETAVHGAPRVRFEYNAVLKPGFYVPPFVGPWLIQRQIIKDLEAAARRVETILREEARIDES